jgi:AcrR family transcriptional regulator
VIETPWKAAPMSDRDLPARERILVATIACLERDGIGAVTTRAIAREAGANIAAINYYFQSKDRLVALALERTLDEAFAEPIAALDRLRAASRPRDALIEVLDELVVGALRYPHIAFAHLRGPITRQDYDTPAIERLRGFLDALHARLGGSLRARGAVHRRAALSQLWSVIIMTGLLPGLARETAGIDLHKPRTRRAYVETLVEAFFH